jgi:hypothetical protein
MRINGTGIHSALLIDETLDAATPPAAGPPVTSRRC